MGFLTIEQLDVLLVEPSSTQHRIIADYLSELGARQVRQVSGGGEALQAMHDNVPDLVISAMHLPDITGTELVQRMRKEDSLLNVAFMLISSETDIRYLEPIRQAGAIAILPKPFDRDQLQTSLRATLDFLEPDPLQLKNFAPDELKVLVVDDSFTSRHIIRQMLERLGVEQILEAENGHEAQRLIEQEFFDLVVTDYHMPRMDGRELSRFIREHSSQPGVPVLMVTSETDRSRLAGIEQSGVSAVFDKPFTIEILRGMMEKLIA